MPTASSSDLTGEPRRGSKRQSERSFWIVLGIACLTYALIGVVITFPLILDLGGSIVATAGDPFGALYSLWLSVREPIVSAFPHAPVLVWTGALATKLFGEVVAYNLMVLGGFVLGGGAMFALVYRLTRSVSGSFIAGLILMLSPYHVAQALQHVGLANLHWLILFLLALLWFDEQPSARRGILFAVSFATVMLDSYLYGIFALLVVGLFAAWRFGLWLTHTQRKSWHRRQWTALGLSLGLGFALIVPALYPIVGSLLSAEQRSTELVRAGSTSVELAAFSARGFAYVTPPPDTILVGSVTKPLYDGAAEQGTNVTELSLYLGVTTILLAVIGVIGMRRAPIIHPRARRWASFWLLLGLVGVYFSFAPTMNLFGLTLSTPGAVLFQLVPLLRVYSRFGLLVLIPLAVLAGFGVAWIAAKIPSTARRWTTIALLAILIVCDLLALPADRVVAVDAAHAPAVYQWLASAEAQAVGAIAEYPLVPPDEPDGYDYQLWQRVHPHHSVNLDYAQTGDTEERAQLADLNREDTLARLRAMGVTHVLIHTAKYTPAGAKKYPLEYHGGAPIYLSPSEPGIFIEGTFGTTNVYRIQ